jgi:hypothetical protein
VHCDEVPPVLKVIPLRYGTIFRKVFGDREVFNHFVSDALDMMVEVDAVHQEYRYPSAVGKVNVEYDLFGEDVGRRVIVEVQHIREQDFFDRFLHDHLVSIVEQAEGQPQYRVERDVFTLVVLTTQPRERELQFSVAVSGMDPVSEQGARVGVYRHRLVFLNPKVINAKTPRRVRPWLELIADSLDGEVDEAKYPDPTMQRALRSAVTRSVSPDELARIKDEAAWEATKADARAEGQAEGKAEGLRLAVVTACDLLGVELTDARRAWLTEADAAALEERLRSLRATRVWA